jgi:hypothetical protein
MAAAPQLDYDLTMQSFLLSKYSMLVGGAGPLSEEQLQWRMGLEAFLLSMGTGSLRTFQRVVRFTAEKPEGMAVLEWFVEFATGGGTEWLANVDIEILRLTGERAPAFAAGNARLR